MSSQKWRRGSIIQSYGILDSRFNNADVYNVGNGLEQANWNQRQFKYIANVPVALDEVTGLLVPPWAFAALGQATFAAAFAGWIDVPFDNTEKRVTLFIGGGAMMEVALETPGQILLGSGMTLVDNPVATIDPLNPTDPASAWLHPFYFRLATAANEVIGYTRSYRAMA
jgi:hypothetical protein